MSEKNVSDVEGMPFDFRVGDSLIRGLVGEQKTIGDSGYSYFEAVLHPGQLNDLAKAVEDEYPNLAKELEKARDRGESLLVSDVIGKNGEPLKIKVGKMGEAEIRDIVNIQKGVKDWEGTSRDIAYKVSPETMHTASSEPFKENKALWDSLTEDVRTYKDIALREQAVKWAGYVQEFYKKMGREILQVHKHGGGGGEFKFRFLGDMFSLSLKGGTEFSKQEIKQAEINFLYYLAARAQQEAMEVATTTVNGKPVINWKVFEEQYAKRMHKLFKELDTYAKTKDPSVFANPDSYIRKYTEELKKSVPKMVAGPLGASIGKAADFYYQRIKENWRSPQTLEASMRKAVKDSGLMKDKNER